ncbi:MAG: hypothetical protein ABIO55_16140 [Ginsengibacter sp.]
MAKNKIHTNMRIYHRYLGFFLAGIMGVYAVSGVVMIFRDTDFLKQNKQVQKKLAPALNADQLGRELHVRDLKFESVNGDTVRFKQGVYNKRTGMSDYTTKSLPVVMEKFMKLHTASTSQPLFYLNVFFGVSLLFFVLSSFWMFMPETSIFRKGLYFTLAGLVLTLLMLFL